MNTLKKSLLSVSTLLLLAACGGDKEADTVNEVDTDDQTEQVEENDTDQNNDTNEQNDDQSVQSKKVNLADTEFSVSMKDAVDIFNKEFDGAEIESIELDEENGQYFYEIEARDGRDLAIDAQSGDIAKKDDVQDDDDMDDQAINPADALSPKEAIDKALEVAGADAFVESWSLSFDDDHGVMTYEIDFENVDDVELDAVSGEILADK